MLMGRLAKRIADKHMRGLIRRCLSSGARADDDQWTRHRLRALELKEWKWDRSPVSRAGHSRDGA